MHARTATLFESPGPPCCCGRIPGVDRSSDPPDALPQRHAHERLVTGRRDRSPLRPPLQRLDCSGAFAMEALMDAPAARQDLAAQVEPRELGADGVHAAPAFRGTADGCPSAHAPPDGQQRPDDGESGRRPERRRDQGLPGAQPGALGPSTGSESGSCGTRRRAGWSDGRDSAIWRARERRRWSWPTRCSPSSGAGVSPPTPRARA